MAEKGANCGGVYDVVIVGAGIMGSCAAYEVAKRGHSVLLLEQFDVLHRRGSSHGESRTMRLTYTEDYYTLMAKRSLQLWRAAEAEAGYSVYTETGHLEIGKRTRLERAIQACKRHNVPHEILDSFDHLHLPFQLPHGFIAVRTKQAGVLNPTKSVAMFQMLAVKHGAEIRDRARVCKISEASGGAAVETSNGSYVARMGVIIAAGAWTAKLVDAALGFALHLPIQPVQTFIAYWEIDPASQDAFLPSSGFPCFAFSEGDDNDDNCFYGTPSLELPGLLKVSIHGGVPCDPESRSYACGKEALGEMLGPWIRSVFMGKVKSEAPVKLEGCMYSMTPDHDFIIDTLPAFANTKLVVAGGFSGHGFKMGPIVGQITADLVIHGASHHGIPLEHFSTGRFTKIQN